MNVKFAFQTLQMKKDQKKSGSVSQARKHVSLENIEYNTQRTRMFFSEYGRNIQRMVDKALLIEDREKRNKAAQNIVNVMSYLNPQVRELENYKHKLWDHLFMLSDYKLDVDSPYPKPEKESFTSKPKRISYPSSRIKYKYYGKVMEDMIGKISKLDEGKSKEQISQNLANFMKMSYLTWNKDTVDDTTILSHLKELSDDQLKLHESARLNHTAEILAMNKEKLARENAARKKVNKRKVRKK
ncbi:MAG: DUF4290 domain-containing protein [Bacteroidetes bacterium]|nr:MAG: DUF4290 domain-containing protein [Bacteroidota bacterium]REK32503.1 MAG: DUF4290 domain-containing protein [Bacteroidota bacterium]REK49050.1 MAG: DUF4290 domain-containing protein [Bacteroidota bacterium]